MKLTSLEMMFCKNAYDLLLWFKKNKNLNIPSREDFGSLLSTPEIKTLGIWLDHFGLLSVLKIDRSGSSPPWGLSEVSFPVCAEDVVKVNSALSKASCHERAKITLWLQPDTAGSRLTEIEGELNRIGFVRDFAYNWDYVACE